MTMNEAPCVFPFSYGREMHLSCITGDRKVPWCATHVDLDGEPISWQYCNTTHRKALFIVPSPRYAFSVYKQFVI